MHIAFCIVLDRFADPRSHVSFLELIMLSKSALLEA